MHKVIVQLQDVNQRLDHYMSDLLSDVSRSVLQTWIKKGHILVNGKQSKSNYRLREEDEISYEIIEHIQTLKPTKMDLDIIYEDEYLLIVNKEKGLIVHPSPSSLDQLSLVHALLAYTDKLSDINGEYRPGIVHRLDKDTSGLLIVAKTNEVHEYLVEMLKHRTIKREYLALVHHPFVHKEAIIDAPIGRDPNNRQKMTVTHLNSKEAKTKIFLEENMGDYGLMRCELDTGRTHQIRVHLEYIKHPIVGDQTYSYKNTLETQGQLLHAHHLAFIHPITKENLSFYAPMPDVFEKTLAMVRRLK